MVMNKIITHNGQFHADEVLAIATLMELGVVKDNIPIERVASIDALSTSVRTFVLDIGQLHKTHLLCFDHHQDANLESTCVLVLNWVVNQGYISPDVAEQLYNSLYKSVSDIDRGIVTEKSTSFNAIVRSFNIMNDLGFDAALIQARLILKVYIMNAEKAVKDIQVWASLQKSNGIAITESSEVIHNWKEYAKKDNVILLCCPSNRGNGWNLISRDSQEFVIPVDNEQTYRHNSGFLAVYQDKGTALRMGYEHLNILKL
jgi:uncharacterized UPF0160 family protein